MKILIALTQQRLFFSSMSSVNQRECSACCSHSQSQTDRAFISDVLPEVPQEREGKMV